MSQTHSCLSLVLPFLDSERELRIWKRVIEGTLGDVAFATLAGALKRELVKVEEPQNA